MPDDRPSGGPPASSPEDKTTRLGPFRPQASASGALSVGQIIANRYRVLRYIGKGGMGEVYEAEDCELRERIALKTILPEVARQEESIQRFKREIHLARKVTHPNVCRIFDFVYHGDAIFLTMELLEGETLAQRLRRGGALSTREALPIVTQMAAGLGAAHQAGIVHRDFKSGNVMLVKDASPERRIRAVVTDFGLARRLSTIEDSMGASTAGAIAGTPAYMAPEQVEGREITPAADIYALGVVMYEMVTGRCPFDGDTPLSIAVKRLTEPAPSPRSHNPALDPRWERAILGCLVRDPQARFQSTAEVLKALETPAAPVAPSEQPRTLEAAAPKHASVGRSMQVLAMIRRVDSGGLKSYIQVEEITSIREEDVRAKPFRLEFPLDRTGAPQAAEIAVKLDSPDFEPKTQTKKLKVPPDGDSDVCTFLLTPQVSGELLLNLEVLKGEVLVASRAMRTMAEVGEPARATAPNVLVSIPLEVFAYGLPAAFKLPPRTLAPGESAASHLRNIKGVPPGRGRPAAPGGSAPAPPEGGMPIPQRSPAAPAPTPAAPPAPRGSPLHEAARLERLTGESRRKLQTASPRAPESAPTAKTPAPVAPPAPGPELNTTVPVVTPPVQAAPPIQATQVTKSPVAGGGFSSTSMMPKARLKAPAAPGVLPPPPLPRPLPRGEAPAQTALPARTAKFPPQAVAAFVVFLVALGVGGLYTATRHSAPPQMASSGAAPQPYPNPRVEEPSVTAPSPSTATSAPAMPPPPAESGPRPTAAPKPVAVSAPSEARTAPVMPPRPVESTPKATAAPEPDQQNLDMLNADREKFNEAVKLQNNGKLQEAMAEFKALSANPGPYQAQAQDRYIQTEQMAANAVMRPPVVAGPSRTTAQPMPATAPPATMTMAYSHNPTFALLPGGNPQPWTLPWSKGMIVPDYNVDGGLQPVSLTMAPVQGAPAGSIVLIKISIDENGNVTPNQILNDTNGLGPEVRKAASDWKFKPPKARGKPVATSTAVKVTF